MLKQCAIDLGVELGLDASLSAPAFSPSVSVSYNNLGNFEVTFSGSVAGQAVEVTCQFNGGKMWKFKVDAAVCAMESIAKALSGVVRTRRDSNATSSETAAESQQDGVKQDGVNTTACECAASIGQFLALGSDQLANAVAQSQRLDSSAQEFESGKGALSAASVLASLQDFPLDENYLANTFAGVTPDQLKQPTSTREDERKVQR